MALYSAASHLIDNLGLDHLNSININLPVYCTGASIAGGSSSSSTANSKTSSSALVSATMQHHANQNQNQNPYPPSYYSTHPHVNTAKASTSTATSSWRTSSPSSRGGFTTASGGSGNRTAAAVGSITPLTPPLTSTFTSRTTRSTSDEHYGHQHPQRLPSIAQLERGTHYQLPSHRQHATTQHLSSSNSLSSHQSQQQAYPPPQSYLQPQPQQHLPPCMSRF